MKSSCGFHQARSVSHEPDSTSIRQKRKHGREISAIWPTQADIKWKKEKESGDSGKHCLFNSPLEQTVARSRHSLSFSFPVPRPANDRIPPMKGGNERSTRRGKKEGKRTARGRPLPRKHISKRTASMDDSSKEPRGQKWRRLHESGLASLCSLTCQELHDRP
jgi:hypothetical protein